MKKLLLIAYYFPPLGGSGVQRATKFVKYLSEFGWQPYVIAAERPMGEEGWDHTLLEDLPPNTPIWRLPVPSPKPANHLARLVGWRPRTAHDPSPAAAIAGNGALAGRSPLAVRRLRRAILAPLYLVQDPPVDTMLYWSLSVVPFACRLIWQEQIDAVMTTVAPFSALLAGAILRRLTGRPWITDFRDLWTQDTSVYNPGSSGRLWLDTQLEKGLIDRMDAVISVTQPCVEALRARAGARGRGKPFVVIPNGWDRADFSGVAPSRDPDLDVTRADGKLLLLHPGSAYRGEVIPLVQAVARTNMSLEAIQRLCFLFIGYMHPDDSAAIAASPQRSRFEMQPSRISHTSAVNLMNKAQVLLLLRANEQAFSGKIFEYMLAGRPVLAIATGASAELVRSSGIGCVVSPGNHAELSRVLSQIALNYAGFVAEYYHPNWEVIGRYDRRILTGQLAQLLDRLVQRQTGQKALAGTGH